MIAALRWERGIRWEELDPEDQAEVAALWLVRWRDGQNRSE